jgi:two-component system, chemotaxis family, chemotaxis protein CheY
MSVEKLQNAAPKRDKAYDLGKFRVLIIEDFSFIADLLASSLNELGVGEVILANNLAAGKDKILNHNAVPSPRNIDVVILDWLMPDGKGSELLKWARGHKSDTIRYLPMIVCSAYASTELVVESRDCGANEVLVKPVSAEKMSKRILSVIDRPRAYIKTPEFFGPDRRRKIDKFTGEERRMAKPEDIQEHHERLE